jgi:hypothetical protein
LFFKSFYNLQTNLNSIKIQILTTSTRKIKYKNTSAFKENMHRHELQQINIYLII